MHSIMKFLKALNSLASNFIFHLTDNSILKLSTMFNTREANK